MDQSNQQFGWITGNLVVVVAVVALLAVIILANADTIGTFLTDTTNQAIDGLPKP